MPVARELQVVYGTITCGASTARQITDYHIHEEGYESGFFEFEIITTATSEAAFETEINALIDEFRTPRLDLVVTLGGTDILTRKHSDNSALDTNPTIIKNGDPADTGRSRHLRIRVEYGMPADNVGTNFRRFADTIVEYSPSRLRTVTYRGEFTAELGGDSTAAFAQYRERISAALTATLNIIDSTATFETIAEPDVTYNETNKVCEFEIVAKEILENQASGTLNDNDIVDPILTIEREKYEPGDSLTGEITLGGGAVQGFGEGGNQGPGREGGSSRLVSIGGGGTQSGLNTRRPVFVRVHYECSIDASRTKDLDTKYFGTIRPFILSFAKNTSKLGQGVAGGIVLRDTFAPDYYNNRIVADLELIVYSGNPVYEKKTTFSVTLEAGKRLVGVLDGDPFSYYEYQASSVKIARSQETYKQVVGSNTNPQELIRSFIGDPNSVPSVLGSSSDWVLISRQPTGAILIQGVEGDGSGKKNIAEVTIETVAQFRRRKAPSIQNFGGITGTGENITLSRSARR